MAEFDVRMKDGSISDVISAADKNETVTEEKQQAESGVEKVRLEENNGKNSNGDGEQFSTADSTYVPGKTSPNSYTEELDLTDPNSVIHMLENVDLTEEDTEDLLQEAYKMNKKLKEMLRRQDEECSESKPKMKSRSKSYAESRSFNGNGSHPSSATSSSNNSRMGSSFGIRKVLPPIHAGEKERSVYTIKLQRSKTNVETRPTFSDSAVLRSKSSNKPTITKDSESATRRRKAPGPKPEWNDRFNYT